MIIDYKNPEGKKEHYFISNFLEEQLRKVKESLTQKDVDFVLLIDGPERSGKSNLASQVSYYVDPSFNQSRMCLTPEEFIRAINEASPGQAVVYDEAYTGLSNRQTFSKINKILISMLMEMGKKNLFVIIVLPSLFYLEKYVVLHRSRALLHVLFNKGRRGLYTIYNSQKLKQLYIKGKANMSYSYPRITLPAQRFGKKSPIDWKTYEKRKIESLLLKQDKGYSNLEQKQTTQRDFLLKVLKDKGMKYSQISKLFKENGIEFRRDTIRKAVNRMEARMNETET